MHVSVNHCDEIRINSAGLMQDLRAAVFFLPVYAQSLNTDYKDRADQQVK